MAEIHKGRGALSQPPGRFDKFTHVEEKDGWYEEDEPGPKLKTTAQPEAARTIISRNQSPDIHFGQSINPYRGCEHGCVYCLRGDTKILMADGTTRPIADLKVGDAIFGSERVGWQRRYVKTRVLAHWSVTKPAFRIALQDGTELAAGPDHRFLTERGWKFVTSAEGRGQRPSLALADRLMGFGASPPEGDINGQVVATSTQLAITGIDALGENEQLFDITTGTEDFIANGVVSHNCYARPSHAYIGLSPGIDFETKLFYKPDAARLLERELDAKNYQCAPIMLGANTDPYQPLEREHKITRSLLEVLLARKHPVAITTKSALVARDADLLAELARDQLVRVMFSIPTLNPDTKRILEPRASSAAAKLKAMRVLADAGVPVGVLVAPIIPVITEHEIEAVLEASREAGASVAGYTMLRLPYEVKDLFREWLEQHFPERAAHVMSQVRAMRGGRDNDPDFGTRMHATGAVAALIRQRFALAKRRLGFTADRRLDMATHLFQPRGRKVSGTNPQLSLDFPGAGEPAPAPQVTK
jgi:DNA repair photolyase